MNLSPKFGEALKWAHTLHINQRRKGSSVPYVAHLLGVASTVLEYGGDEETAIAALLHDAIEDQGDKVALGDIQERFGPNVADYVSECTEEKVEWKDIPKEEWPDAVRARRELALTHLTNAHFNVRLIKAADSLYNLRSVVAQYRLQKEATFDLFKGGVDGTLWHFTARTKLFLMNGPRGIGELMASELKELHKIRYEYRLYNGKLWD